MYSPETAIFTSGKSSKCNGRHHAFGSVLSSETRMKTSFKVKVKRSRKRYISELGPAKS